MSCIKRLFLVGLILASWSPVLANRPKTDKLIDQFLHAKTSSNRREAYDELVAHPERHSTRVVEMAVQAFSAEQPTSDASDLCYLVCVLRPADPKALLTLLWANGERLDDGCAYCCPESLVLTLYQLRGRWKPSGEEPRGTAQGDSVRSVCYLHDLRLEQHHVETPDTESDGEWFLAIRSAPQLTDRELLAQAGDETGSYERRLAAAAELAARTVDDQHLLELYWIALNPYRDAAGEFTCSIQAAIERAELYRARRNSTDRKKH